MKIRRDKLRIVGIGGGTGLPVLLTGLTAQPDVDVSAIVSVADNGGSSGRLRESFGIPAVGDLRNCLVALAGEESPLAELFQHRFSGGDVNGHSLGNLIVAALCQKTGSLRQALTSASQLLPLKGRAFAATEASTTLCASFCDGMIVCGESQIAAARGRIQHVWLEPGNPPASPGVVEAILQAQAIVIGPGSLYTSLVPNLLVAGIADAIRRSHAIKILVCNLTTEPGETDNFKASDHLRVVQSYLGSPVDLCVMNSDRSRANRSTDERLVQMDADEVRSLGAVPVEEDLWTMQEGQVRHDAYKLGRLVASAVREPVAVEQIVPEFDWQAA